MSVMHAVLDPTVQNKQAPFRAMLADPIYKRKLAPRPHGQDPVYDCAVVAFACLTQDPDTMKILTQHLPGDQMEEMCCFIDRNANLVCNFLLQGGSNDTMAAPKMQLIQWTAIVHAAWLSM